MSRDRRLDWDGCNNVRDLGGLRTTDGRVTRLGALVRSDHPGRLTPHGWSALYEYGIRTIITLATDGLPDDVPADTMPRPADIVTLRCAIEDYADTDFVQQWVMTDLWATPLYFYDAMKRWPERYAAVVTAVARAQPGGVLFHCVRGNDRTGIVALLLLALVGVVPEEIIADYELSPDPERDILLARHNTTTRETILATLAQLDFAQHLQDGGLSQADLTAVRTRLLEPTDTEVNERDK